MHFSVVNEFIDSRADAFFEIAIKIWEYAELGLMEFKSSELLASVLERNGFSVKRGVSGMPTAFIASWGDGKPVIGLLGEYDALPGLSQKAVPWREPLVEGAPGHGCGHNIHGTSALASALAVKEAMEKLGIKGTVRFYGTPAEENFSGKVYMVRDGLFDDVDAVLSHHPSDMNAATLLSSLAVRSCRFHFFGRASHASVSPEEGRSALDGVELMNIGVNYLREHVIQEARIHYIIERGGEQPNIVPEYARSWYYIRAPEVDQLESIFERVVDIARGAALMSGTKVDVEILDAMYNVIPNGPIAAKIVDNMRSLGVPELSEEERRFAEEIAKTIPIQTKENELRKSKRPGWGRLIDKLIDDEVPEPWGDGDYMMGSTDVGDVSWKAPTVEFNTAAWVLGTPAHSWQSTAQSGSPLARRSLIFASKVMSLTALDLLTDEDLLERAKEDHLRRLRGRTYKLLIPESLTPPLNFWRDQFKV